ncbi:hypothetical protein T265_03215 [Opisthorchis viverrini]|uniref:Uncharacterized protein n=1 Tax=Opisthorchis viverrini TaxID=6198 RepID=A0A074ZWT9_OPIVI|nr:hypothetical protein T265_03215 [Opisthorchis viverrini]KER30382.1 hypothetical protein T265_03215 [Opisthorchis viverrini]
MQGCKEHYKRRKLSARASVHTLATWIHEQLTLISAHEDGERHKSDWNDINILEQTRAKKGREYMEAWYSIDGAANRLVVVDPVYQSLRTNDIQKGKPEPSKDSREKPPNENKHAQVIDELVFVFVKFMSVPRQIL